MEKGQTLKAITVSGGQRAILERIRRARASDQGLVGRIKMILGGAAGMSNSEIVRQHNVGHESVRRWRTRWQASRAQFEEIESSPAVENEQARMDDLEELICEVLRDEQRSGAPAKFSAEQQVKIIAVACEEPTDSGRPISHWTCRELADEVMKRGIVSSISARSVGRFLK